MINGLSQSIYLQCSACILCYYTERVSGNASHHAASLERFVAGGR